jgi:hypothetical protein
MVDSSKSRQQEPTVDPNTHRTEAAGLFSGSCFKCLGWDHFRATCSSQIRCKSCFNYGHISRNCFARRKEKTYRPKSSALLEPSSASVGKAPSGAEQAGFKSAPLGDRISSPSSQPLLSPATADAHAAVLAAMANNPVDPDPFVPRGFVVCHRSLEEDTP